MTAPLVMRRHITRAIGRLAAPLALAHVGQALISLTDTAVVGRVGAADLAGVALGNSIFFTFFVVCMGAVLGMEPLVSQAVGARDPARARRAMRQGVLLALCATLPGALAMVAVLWGLPTFGVDESVIAPTRAYVVARLPGLFPLLAFTALRGFLQGHNVTRPAVVATFVAVVVNVPADLLFVFGHEGLGLPALGAEGAGIATVIVNVVMLALLVPPVVRLGREELRVVAAEGGRSRVSLWREAFARRDELLRIVKVGAPMGLQFAFEVAFFSSVSFLMGRMGAGQLAAHQVAISIASAPFHACLGIGGATAVIVGQRIGDGDRHGALVAGTSGIGLGFGFMGLSGIVFVLFPGAVVSLFTDEASVIETATVLVRIAGFFAVSDGVQAVASGALRGAGDTAWPFAIHLCSHWAIGMPAALTFAFVVEGGAAGLWWGLTVGLTASALALTTRFVIKARRGYVALEQRAFEERRVAE